MADTGFVLVSSGVNTDDGGDIAWENPGNITADDDARAGTASFFFEDKVSQRLDGLDPHNGSGFSAIGSGDTIDGIEVQLARFGGAGQSTDHAFDHTIQLINGGTPSGDNKADTGTPWPTSTETLKTYGGANDLWSLSLGPADVKASDFGVAIKTAAVGGTASCNVDAVWIKVYYTAGAGGGDVDVAANTDALTLTENTAAIAFDRNVQAGTDTLTLTEHQATVALGINVDAGTDALTLTENAATVTFDRNVLANTDALALTENAAAIAFDRNVQAGTAALTLTALAASISAETNVQAGTDALTVTALAAAVSAGNAIAANVHALTLTEFTATVGAATNVQTNTAALALTEHTATVTVEAAEPEEQPSRDPGRDGGAGLPWWYEGFHLPPGYERKRETPPRIVEPIEDRLDEARDALKALHRAGKDLSRAHMSAETAISQAELRSLSGRVGGLVRRVNALERQAKSAPDLAAAREVMAAYRNTLEQTESLQETIAVVQARIDRLRRLVREDDDLMLLIHFME